MTFSEFGTFTGIIDDLGISIDFFLQRGINMTSKVQLNFLINGDAR